VSDDELLKGLARAVREERDAEAHGRADAELARPLDEAARGRFADAALRAMGTAPAREPRPRARVVRLGAAVAGVVALAAAVLVYVRGPGAPTLPPYEVSLVGGDSQTRSAPAAGAGDEITVRADGYLEIRLRPEHAPGARPEVHAAVVHDGTARPWAPRVEVSTDGAVRVAGPVSTLFDDPRGTWEVLIAMGSAGAVPVDPGAIARAAPSPSASLHVYRVVVRIRP
jgi:hypothetical protein